MSQTFHISVGPPFLWLILALFAPLLVVAWFSPLALLVLAGYAALSVVVMILVCTITINAEGFVLNRVFRCKWSEVKDAKYKSFLGLPYLLVSRGALRWWIPLYVRRLKEFKEAVVANAPVGNPFRVQVEAHGGI
jgi:hypothetical protein